MRRVNTWGPNIRRISMHCGSKGSSSETLGGREEEDEEDEEDEDDEDDEEEEAEEDEDKFD